jgi:hypothetical protein
MCSGGIRVGAWDFLKWKHIIPILTERGGERRKRNDDDDGQAVAATGVSAAKMVVYADEPEQYYTYITPEAFYALKEWLAFRQSHGENIG